MPRDVGAQHVDARKFAVHAAVEGRHRSEMVHAAGFESAAVAFLESCTPALDADGRLTVIVHECATGREHCYALDMDSGEAVPCH